MQKIARILVSAIFLLWVLPFGAFIKPPEEKRLCGGKRAICLCSHITQKDASGGAGVKFSPCLLKSESSPSTYPFLVLDPADDLDSTSSRILDFSLIRYSRVMSSSIEHVPKV